MKVRIKKFLFKYFNWYRRDFYSVRTLEGENKVFTEDELLNYYFEKI